MMSNKKKQSSPTITVLPDHIIPNILIRLPEKSLARFKLVSRSWLKLIISLVFHNAQLNRATDDKLTYKLTGLVSSRLIPDKNHSSMDPPLDIPICNARVGKRNIKCNIVGSCNGILCLLHGFYAVGLLNPTTGEYKELPPIVRMVPISIYTYTSYGFGYDPISRDYVVLQVTSFDDDYFDLCPSEAQLYTLSTNSWKTVASIPYVFYRAGLESEHSRPGELVNGTFHWLAVHYTDPTRFLIAAFDISLRRSREIALPDYDITVQVLVDIKELNGHLCFMCYYGRFIKVWTVRNDGLKDSWVVMFGVENLPAVPRSMWICIPIWITKEGDVLVHDDKSGKLFLYDMIDKSYRKVRIGNKLVTIRWPTVFTRSLVSLNAKKVSSYTV